MALQHSSLRVVGLLCAGSGLPGPVGCFLLLLLCLGLEPEPSYPGPHSPWGMTFRPATLNSISMLVVPNCISGPDPSQSPRALCSTAYWMFPRFSDISNVVGQTEPWIPVLRTRSFPSFLHLTKGHQHPPSMPSIVFLSCS